LIDLGGTMTDPNRIMRGMLNEIAPDVWYLPIIMANVYFIGRRGGPWLLIDAGLPAGGLRIRTAAEFTFGCKPEAIVLTHGHFDHVGALPDLADRWGVSIYAHRLEAPFLTGRSDYPDPDPTVGGFMAQGMSRLFPHHSYNFGDRVRLLPEDGSLPYMPEWRWIGTPGHTSGHVSLFRESDRTLIAGDAFITVNQENPAKLLSQVREIRNPPAYLTQDWDQARDSVIRLAGLRPRVVAAGHGLPMAGPDIADTLASFAAAFTPPAQGRYVNKPVRTDETGAVVWAPPAPHDPVPMYGYAAGVALAAAAGAALLLAASKRKSASGATSRNVQTPPMDISGGLLPSQTGFAGAAHSPRLSDTDYEALGVREHPVARNVESAPRPEGEL